MSTARQAMEEVFANVERRIDESIAAADAAFGKDHGLRRSSVIKEIISDHVRRMGAIGTVGGIERDIDSETIVAMMREAVNFVALTEAFVIEAGKDIQERKHGGH